MGLMLNETLDYLYGLERFGIKLGLDVIEQIMASLGNPHQSFKSVHVAGTNGKGSTCAFVARVLQEAGYTVGLYTSPHLVRFNERICINGEEITDHELIYFTDIIRKKIEEKGIQPTFFEFTTALAFLYFAHKHVDIAVVEVGMGGRLDATNIIQPLVSVITNISLDHMEHLGKTVSQIAREKAGIIKPGCLVVTAEKNPRVVKYFKQVCAERNVELLLLHEQLRATVLEANLEHQKFDVSGAVEDTYTIPLLGAHQIVNACTALLVLRSLEKRGFSISPFIIKKGLEATAWAGRLDLVSYNPLVLVDGAHNVAGIKALCDFLRTLEHRKVLVIAIANDKDRECMLQMIVPLFEEVIVTQGHFKPTPADVLADDARAYSSHVREIPGVGDAIEIALSIAAKEDTVLFTGSLYMIGDVLAILRKKMKVHAPL